MKEETTMRGCLIIFKLTAFKNNVNRCSENKNHIMHSSIGYDDQK